MKFRNIRIISLLLVLVMLCGMMPMTAFAAEEAEANPWNGRSAVFVGDSITAGSGTTKIYYSFLEEALGFDSVTAMGVGGSCISAASDYGTGNQPLINRYETIPSADLIVIFMGTNDYGHETPLGTVEDTEDGTFYGALNTIIPALVAKHTSSKIVFVTPLHRYGFGTSKILGTSFTSDDVANGVGATLGDYVDALKTVCANNGVSVIDLYTECTLDPADTDTRTNYMPDGLHPNAAGHEVIAGIMESHIRGYEPVEGEPIVQTELIHGNKFAAGNNQSCRASSRLNYYLKAGTVITLNNPDVMQWACAKTSDENSSSNLGYFPDSDWSDKETAVVAEDGWIGFTFKYRDETQSFDLTKPLSDYITIEEPHTHTYENGTCTGCGATVSPYLQQLPENIIGCNNLYDLLTPLKGYYTATKYDTSNGAVLSVVIPVEPGDRIAASSFGPVSENMGSVNGIRVTYLLGNEIVSSLSPGDVYSGYMANGYITVPDGVDAVCVPWWKPSDSNWLTLSQISNDFAVHIPKTVSAQAPTCTESGYTAGEICEVCNASLGEREEIPATGHSYSGDTCTICGSVNLLAFLDGKYVSILGDSISTFNGYSNDAAVNTTIGGNGPRYDAGTADTKPGSYCLLESVDDTWWMHFANRSGMKLLVNNSWAGSQVFGGQTSDGRVIPAAYLARCINLHDNTTDNNPGNAPINPDVILVYLGINDYNFNRNNVGSGAVDYAKLLSSDGSYVTPTTFGEAYGIMLCKMRNAYPDAQIFAMTLLPENLYSVDMAAWEQHNAYIRAAAEYYDIPLVDLAEKCAITWENYSGYMMDKIHPTTAGMKLISDCIEAELVAYYTENLPHAHTYTSIVTAPTCTEQGYTTYTCDCGESFVDDYADATGHSYANGSCTGCGVAAWDTDGDGALEILAIGNSFSVDALESVYQIAESLGIENIVLGNLYKGSCTLATHAKNAKNNTAAYAWFYNDNGTWSRDTNTWKDATEKTMGDALQERTWDFVSLQQASGSSGQPDTYNADLDYLIQYVSDNAPGAKLVWHMTWAYQQNTTHSAFPTYGKDQMTMYNAIVSAVQSKIVTNGNFDLIVPNGTAVQNSRTSLLGDTTTIDGYHMSRPYGRYLTSLMFVKAITGMDISNVTYAPSGVDAEEKAIAIESANNAAAKPFEVTQSAYVKEEPELPDEGYILLKPELHKGAYWYPTDAKNYNTPVADATNSKYYFATPRFTKEDLPVGSIIVLESGWQYRPDGWVADTVQTGTREPVTTTAYVVITEEWWGSYTLRGFNIAKVGTPSIMDLSAEDIHKVFRIYVPEEKHSHAYTSAVITPTCTEQGYTTYTCTLCGDTYVDDYVDATGHDYANGSCVNCGDTLTGKKVSILSHSMSTYAGVSNSTAANSTLGNNDVYYTEGRHDVYLEDTWWQQAIDALGMELLVNNSWSGSCVFMPRKGEASVGYGDRAVNLHNDHTGEEPDVIWVYLGCNDFAYYKDTFGKAADVDYAALIQDNGDGTYIYATPATACEAYAIMLHKIETRYPDAEIYCITSTARRETDYTGDSYPDAGQPTAYSAELQQIAKYYGYPVVDLENAIPKDVEIFDKYMGDKRAHANALGMDQITNEVLSVVLGKDAEICHVICEDGIVAEQAVLLGGSYSAEVELREGYSVVVTMGGEDITAEVCNNGKISIDEVTGDIVVCSEIQRDPLAFHWVIQDDALVSVGDTDNAASKLSGTIENGVLNDTIYQLETAVVLKHDLPWAVEWKCSEDWRGAVLSSHEEAATKGMTYLSRVNGGQLCFGTYTGSQYDNYGIDISYLNSDTHTYLLENRIAADGSNMIWLYVDGEEIGPMNNYFIGSKAQNKTADWVSGKDFVFSFIGMTGHALRNCQLDYLSVTECVHTYEKGICLGCGAAQPGPVITQQPTNGEAKLGERYMVEVKAEGEGLTYQWYFRNAGFSAWYKSSVKDNTYDDVMTTARAGREVYCVITDANGNSVKTDTVKLICVPSEKLEITKQPTDGEAVLGERYCVTVEAKGEGLKYQWYFRNKGATHWTKSSVTDNTYDDIMNNTRAGREVYCVITDLAGNKVTTETVKLVRVPMKLEIISQPTDATAAFGEQFCATVVAKGEGLKYQWYFRNSSKDSWHKSGVRDNTYDDEMTKARAGREIYCVITDQWGNTITTDTVKLIAVPEVELKLLGVSYESAAMGGRFCVTVEAEGEGLTYQWYFRNAGATRWSKSSVRDNTYDDVMNRTRANREVYCVITDAYGNTVTTDTVKLIAVPSVELKVLGQTYESAVMGERYCVTVEAQGDGLTYQWYFRNAGSNQWYKSSVTDNTYDDVMTKARANREVYCVITDIWGNTVTTETVTLVCTDIPQAIAMN